MLQEFNPIQCDIYFMQPFHMKTPLKSEPLRFGHRWCFCYKSQYLCWLVSRLFSNLNGTRKLKKFKMQNKNGKMVQSEPLRSISNILQSALYLCCPSCPLQLSCLVRRFNSISQNRKNIFLQSLRQCRKKSIVTKTVDLYFCSCKIYIKSQH